MIMDFKIRKMQPDDKKEILAMMEEFYSSDAVATNGSVEIFETDFENCVNNSPYLEGFVFYNDENILGYSMIAKSFSTEYGKKCIWLEDLYVKKEFRGQGIITKFFEYIEKIYSNSIFKLEVDKSNFMAIEVYNKRGFVQLPYIEMKKET